MSGEAKFSEGAWPVDEGLWDEYRNAIVEIELPAGPIVVGPRGVLAAQEVTFPAARSATIHIITAQNPEGTVADSPSNAAATASLLADLEGLDVQTVSALGGNIEWTHTEASVAAIGLTDDQAIELGRKYGQQSIFRWTRATWSLLNCRSAAELSFAWGGVNGDVETLLGREDFAELTQSSSGPRMPPRHMG